MKKINKISFIYESIVQATLLPLFYIAESYLSKEECSKQISSSFKILFNVNDRAVRGTLLQKAPFIEQTFDDETLNTGVFEPMCSGFSDSSPALRELTLKATLVLVPHLTHPNLEKLSRYLVRLQGDQESSIRTNTVIFFSKLAPYLTETTRQKMLLPAFVRAMKDPFTPCRNAALKSTLKAKEFFNPEGIASRVLPAITPQLLDPSPEVRKEAFAAVDELLFVLRQESERLNLVPQPIPQPGDSINTVPTNPAAVVSQQRQFVPETQRTTAVAPGSTNTAAAAISKNSNSGSGYSFGGISSWIGKSQPTPAATQQGGITAPVQTQVPVVAPAPYQQQQLGAGANGGVGGPSRISATIDGSWSDNYDDLDNDNEGWDEDDILDLNTTKVNLPNPPTANGGVKPASSLSLSGNNTSTMFGPSPTSIHQHDEDEFFDAFDVKPAKPVVHAVAGPRKAGGSGKLVVPKKIAGGAATTKLAKPTITKISPSKEEDDNIPDGWDDF